MEYKLLGNSGSYISKYALGRIPFAGTHGFENTGWITQKIANKLVEYALDKGVNQFDTANLYSKEDAEIVLGKAIQNK